jgi:uncharacterized protein YdeI (YjbR/CyaY-like superfamily)
MPAAPDQQPPSRRESPGRPELRLPQELLAALGAAPEARERFDALSPAHRREYVRWVSEARRTDARERRAAQTVMRLLERP